MAAQAAAQRDAHSRRAVGRLGFRAERRPHAEHTFASTAGARRAQPARCVHLRLMMQWWYAQPVHRVWWMPRCQVHHATSLLVAQAAESWH